MPYMHIRNLRRKLGLASAMIVNRRRVGYCMGVGGIIQAKYLFLQWSVPRQGSSAMIGLSNLTVRGLLKDKGFSVAIW